jgi:hypothetical protein
MQEYVNKRAMMTLDRSTDTTASKQCLKQASWPSLMTTESNMWPLVCYKDFSIFGQCDLIFNRPRPIFNLDLEIIKTTFLTNFKTAATRVLKIFFYFKLLWPSFWPDMTNLSTWPRNHQNNLPDKFPKYLNQNCSH